MIKADFKKGIGMIAGDTEIIIKELFGVLDALNKGGSLSDYDRIALMVVLMPDDKKSANMILETVKRIINESDIKKYSPTSIDQSFDLSALDEKEADKIIEKLVKENEKRFK
jgi:hypothetical protein